MKFEEQNVIKIPNYKNSLIYFFVKENEVVYVGQTRNNIGRPLSHKDKDYDTIYIKYCEVDELDSLEDKYIIKYRPKYNKECNGTIRYGLRKVKQKIIKELKIRNFNFDDLKQIINQLNIKTVVLNGIEFISIFEYYDILNYMKGKQKNVNN